MAGSFTEQSVMAVIRAARPSFRNSHGKIVFALHSSFIASGFLLHATGPPAFADDVLSSTSTAEEVGIDHWNEFDDSYAFVYSNPKEGSKRILVKCLAMNEKLLIDALKEGDSDQPVHLEIDVGDYVAENVGNSNNYTSMFKNFGKLVSDVDKGIVGRLSGSSTASSTSQKPSSKRGYSEKPSPQIYEPDDLDRFYSYPQGSTIPSIPGSSRDDLLPGPGAGVYPTRGNYGGPGSMLIGPNDPRFFGGDNGLPGRLPSGVPPGGRFDPFGPPGVPGFEPNRFIRDPRRPRGGANHPDLEPFPDGSDYI